ncbi:MAG: VWA domain-containing protein [Spirochaetales bacterium]|jgi:uncharacterized protein YegL|nr:VWA domain-containing protein [Spirochaetales bacterium]
MGLNDVIEAIPRKTMVLFFLLDTSGSMGGSKIGAVNTAIEEVIPDLRELSASNADALVKAAVLEFSSDVRWITPEGPVDVENFKWQYLDAGGNTSMGGAFRELADKLSTKAFMKEATGSFAPAFFLLSDGEPTDDFAGGLAELKNNNWFKHGIKAAVAIGEDANKTRLAEFTGGIESVLDVHNAAMLKRMIKFVSVRASQVASRSVQVQAPSGAVADPSGAPVFETTAKQQELNAQLAEIAAESKSDPQEEEW